MKKTEEVNKIHKLLAKQHSLKNEIKSKDEYIGIQEERVISAEQKNIDLPEFDFPLYLEEKKLSVVEKGGLIGKQSVAFLRQVVFEAFLKSAEEFLGYIVD